MCPTISISDEVFSNLEDLAVGFDTPSNVIERLLTFYEQQSPDKMACNSQSAGKESNRLFSNKDIQKLISAELNQLPADELDRFTDQEYSRHIFGLSFPLLVKVSNKDTQEQRKEAVSDGGVPRWSWKFKILNGDYAYAICTQWYAKHDSRVQDWLNKYKK